MEDTNIKAIYKKEIWPFLKANPNMKIGEAMPTLIPMMTAGSNAADNAIKDVNGVIVAIRCSFTGNLVAVKGKNAVDIGKGNGSTGYATMPKLTNAVYARQMDKWHDAVKKRNEDLEFNNSLVAKFLAKEISAGDMEKQQRAVPSQDEVDAIKTHKPTQDDSGKDISAYLKLGWKSREEAVKALSEEFKIAG